MDSVIDVDAHVTEPAGCWIDRLPAKWHDVAPRMVRGDDGKDRWYVGDGQVMLTVGHTATAGWPTPFPAAPPTFEETPAAAHDPVARLALLDSLGIQAQVLYPNVGGFGNQAFLALDDPELQLACVRAGVRESRELEELPEPDRAVGNRDLRAAAVHDSIVSAPRLVA